MKHICTVNFAMKLTLCLRGSLLSWIFEIMVVHANRSILFRMQTAELTKNYKTQFAQTKFILGTGNFLHIEEQKILRLYLVTSSIRK